MASATVSTTTGRAASARAPDVPSTVPDRTLLAWKDVSAGQAAATRRGRRGPRLADGPRYALYAGTAVLVLVAMGGFLNADSSTRGSYYTDVNYDNPYSHVQDVFVYDEQGRLIEGARLFDQDGQPIRLGDRHCFTVSEYSDVTPVPDDSKYPYCAENAPFRMPTDAGTASAGPASSAPPAPTGAPSPSGSVTPEETTSAAPPPGN